MGHRARGLLSDGDAWEFFPYEHSAARVYRWGEDGLLGLCDDQMRLCFALSAVE